ncbi:MAG: hypothetical protein ACI4TX_03260, partial [Christensenellales bacterium]
MEEEKEELLLQRDLILSNLVDGVLTVPKEIKVLDYETFKHLDDFDVKELRFEEGSELVRISLSQ